MAHGSGKGWAWSCSIPTFVLWRTHLGGRAAMKRVLLVSTAVLGLASLPALAQQAEPVPPAVPGTGAAPAEAPAPSAGTTPRAPAPKPIPGQAEHPGPAPSPPGGDRSHGKGRI